MPEAPAAAASKAIFMSGTLKEVLGYRLSITAVQHAGITIIVFFPSALRTIRKPMVAGHPGQAALPGSIHSSTGIFLIAIFITHP
jgi:hypothetical protein